MRRSTATLLLPALLLVFDCSRIFASPALGEGGPPAGTLEQQREQLREIKIRLVHGWTLAGVPQDLPALERTIRRRDAQVKATLAAREGYWSRWKDVGHPEISLNAKAFFAPRQLAAAFGTAGSRYYQDPLVLKAVQDGLRHLLAFAYPDCPQPGNWWAWQIGMPLHLIPTLILLEQELDRELYERGLQTVVYLLKMHEDAALEGPFNPSDVPSGKVDMNALWRHSLRLQLGVLLEKPAVAGRWAQRAFAEIAPAGAGYLQQDYSYKFHGAIPMWAYGRTFVRDYGDLVRIYGGTEFGPSAEQLRQYADMLEHLVNGFLYRGRMSPAIIGREISRGPALHNFNQVLPGLAALAASSLPEAERFAALLERDRRWLEPADRIAVAQLGRLPGTEPAPPVNDIFAFPDSDFLQITRPRWAAGIKMHSARNRGYESINGENLQGWFLSHGSMFPMIDGREWDGCWPTLDWTRLPGTTAAEDEKRPNTSAFVGVIRCSSQTAIAAMHLSQGQFTARKSWFIDGDVIVCQGSHISGPGRVETTVIQQPVQADDLLLVDGRAASGELPEQKMSVRSLWLKDIGYWFPGETPVLISRVKRASDWGTIRDPTRYGPTRPVTHEYVTVVIPHEGHQAAYSYVMIMAVSQPQWRSALSVLPRAYSFSMDGISHAVGSNAGATQAVVFWEPGGAAGITTDRPCMVTRSEDSLLVVEPAWAESPLNVTLDGEPYHVAPESGRPAVAKLR